MPYEVIDSPRYEVLDPVVSTGQALNKTVDSIPRQLGLTARAGIEGLAGILDLPATPIRMALEKITGKPVDTGEQIGNKLATYIGLPEPETPTERVANTTAKLMAGTGGFAKGASLLANVAQGPVAKSVLQTMGSNVGQQTAAAAGSGYAGQSSKEAGGNDVQQLASSVIGGLAGGGAASLANNAANAAGSLVRRVVNAGMSPQDMDAKISFALQNSGIDYSQVPERVRQSIRGDVGDFIKSGQNLDPVALNRLLAFRQSGLTPTLGMLTRDPGQFTREQNLAKIAAASNNESDLSGLPKVMAGNNQRLIQNLNDVGASKGDRFDAGERIVNSILGRDAAWQKQNSDLYKAARDLPGGDVPLDTGPLVQNIYAEVAKSGKAAFLPDSINSLLNQLQSGVVKINGKEFPANFDAQSLDNLMTTIATAQRGTTDGNVKMALSAVRDAIDKTPIKPLNAPIGSGMPVTNAMAGAMQAADAQPSAFMDALNQARAAARSRFQWAESSKPVEAALSGVQPDKFFDQFVVGGSVKDLDSILSNIKDKQPLRDAAAAWIKNQALNGSTDEVGTFSQAAFNKALMKLGDRKLSMLFSPEEVDALKASGRAASLMQKQPYGSAVNNSNSGTTLLGKGYDITSSLIGKTPIIGPMVSPALSGIEIGLKQRRALNFAPGLLQVEPTNPMLPSLMGPAIVGGGLLSQ